QKEPPTDAGPLPPRRGGGKMQKTRRSAAPHVESGGALPRLLQKLRKLLGIELRDHISVDRQNLIPRHQARTRRRSPRRSLQHDDPAGQNGDDAAEALLRRGLHPLELLELVLIEKHRVRIELAQQTRNRTAIERLLRADRVSGVGAGERVGGDDRAELSIEIVLLLAVSECGERGDGEQECKKAQHQSGQILAISMWTCGKSFGCRIPSARICERRRNPFSRRSTSTVRPSGESTQTSGTLMEA